MARRVKEPIDLKTMEETYCNLVLQIKLLEEQREFLKPQIIQVLEDRGITKDEYVSLVVQERVSVDDLGLKTALSALLWNKIKKEVVDKDKLEAAVKMGEIDPKVAEKATTRKEIKMLKIS